MLYPLLLVIEIDHNPFGVKLGPVLINYFLELVNILHLVPSTDTSGNTGFNEHFIFKNDDHFLTVRRHIVVAEFIAPVPLL